MHEFHLLKDLIHKIEELALKENACRINCIHIKLGALSHISPEHFAEHFHQAAVNPLYKDAKLDIVKSEDETDPSAQTILLENIEVEIK